MSKRPRILLVNVCAAFALLTATTVPAFDGQEAGLIPGGGPVRSDCYVELKVVGIDNPGPDVRSGRVVSCTDGDPCDIDGECGNGSCTFGVAVCINQTDPNLPACHPPTGLQKLFVNPSKLAGAVPGSLDGSACGSFVAIPLPLKNGAQPAMVQVRLSANATAAKGTSPRRDRDTFVLKCLPRTTPCPATSTTTTTSTTTITTTTAPCPSNALLCSGQCLCQTNGCPVSPVNCANCSGFLRVCPSGSTCENTPFTGSNCVVPPAHCTAALAGTTLCGGSSPSDCCLCGLTVEGTPGCFASRAAGCPAGPSCPSATQGNQCTASSQCPTGSFCTHAGCAFQVCAPTCTN
jgi:hypothetical protein